MIIDMKKPIIQIVIKTALKSFVAAISSCLFLFSYANAEAAPLNVFVSIPPQKEFVQKVGGEQVKVMALLPPGQSPETYSPTPSQMAAIARADIFFTIGVPFERHVLSGMSHNGMPEPTDMAEDVVRVHFSERFKGGEVDPHVWLAPKNVIKMTEKIKDALSTLDPAHNRYYLSNCKRFKQELENLDKRLKKLLSPFKGRKIYVFHPAFGYFAASYGMEQVAVETGGHAPTPKHLTQLIKMARKDGVKAIFVQPQFPAESARVIASSIGGIVIPIDPLAEDYVGNMNTIAAAIADAFQQVD